MSDADPRPAPAKVLVVDDVEQNLVAMRALLADMDIELLLARSGTEALELLLDHDVALALLDVQMPEMDGFTLAEFMRGSQRTREVPIIFLTASPNEPARTFRGYESGAVDFLYKPLDPRVIAGKVAVFVQLHRQRLQLQEQNAQLERVLRLNETMIAVLTHDLRTPLSAISMTADLLNIRFRDGEHSQSIQRLRSSTRRMAAMLDQLLEFTRVRSDSLKLQVRAGNLAEVATNVVSELREAHPAAELELTCAGDTAGEFDVDRMGQVISNLVANAVHHGDPRRPVRISIGLDRDELMASVASGGPIPDDVLPSLFEPFKSFSEKRREGLGLGLYIVQQFVQAHGGSIRAMNREDWAVFEIRIPRAVATPFVPPQEPARFG